MKIGSKSASIPDIDKMMSTGDLEDMAGKIGDDATDESTMKLTVSE